MANKLSANMTNVLIAVAEAGSTITWGRDKTTARALAVRGLLNITNIIDAEGNGEGLVVKITDAGYAKAVELV